MDNFKFIKENNHREKIIHMIAGIFFMTCLLVSTVVVAVHWEYLTETVPIISKISILAQNQVDNTTPLGLFYAHLIGSLFFIPSPDELIYYYGLVKIKSVFLPLIFSLAGYMLAQVANYYLGLKLSPFVLHFISKKKVYSSRRYINKYGSAGIFLFTLLPLPAPMLTFALGIAKYNFSRLFIISAIAKVLEYLIIAGFYIFITT